MKRLILLVTILISGAGIAQQQIEKSLGDFKEVKVYDLIEVELVKANDNKAIITGSYTDEVVLSNTNGILKVKMSFGKSFDGNKTKVILHYTSLDVIDANEGSKILGRDTIKQFEIDLRAQEGASIEIPIDVDFVNVRAVTGGIIITSGHSKSQKATLITGGFYDGEMLETISTEVSVNAGGEASVRASQKVDAKVRAGGNVKIYGNPSNISESTALGGRIETMN